MTLEALIKERIHEHGPLSVADYMAMCLTHPEYGYYMRRDPLGVAGDFTTSPEISQIFGELLGLWLAAQWQKQGRPKEILLVELGPGRGTLMADMLRASKKIDGFHEALTVHLIETSPLLQQKQWKALAGKHPSLSWNATVEELPDLPLYVVANEFFDALPVVQYVDGQERMVVVQKGELAFDPSEGDITEASPASLEIMRRLAAQIAHNGGAGLVVDYGYVGGSRGDSLQALKAHHYHEVLQEPGEADITAHVDFDALGECARAAGAEFFGALPQGKFLLQIGASQRLMSLCAAANDTQKKELMSGFERLISHEQMGELFKVLAVLPKHSPKPEGF